MDGWTNSDANEALPGGLGDMGTKVFILGEQENKILKSEGKRETKPNLVNREFKKYRL